jgi:hypothetical protein
MPPALPSKSRSQPFPAPQLLCLQDFAHNPFLFIDLAGTPQPRPNRFIDLREYAIFFQE